MPSPKLSTDRQLGDAWLHWNGRLKPVEKDSNTQKRIFVGLIFCILLIVAIFLYGIYYFTEPRFRMLHAELPVTVAVLLVLVWGIVFLLFVFSVLSIWFQNSLMAKWFPKSIPVRFLIPFVFKLGRLLGQSRDQISNSFIKVHNSWIRLSAGKIKAEKILVLLPRCLQKPLLNQVRQFSLMRRIPVYVVSGGEMARRIIADKKPEAVISVACERDLLSGIRDLCPCIQIIGIPNYRPEGPCKNTRIHFLEFEQAVQLFLNS
jgi:hypothetical protein